MQAVAGLGLLLSLVALWVDSFGGEAYWDDGTQGVFLLLLTIGCGAAYALAAGRADAAWMAPWLGCILAGYYLWLPAAGAVDQWDDLDAGAWIGFVAAILLLAAGVVWYLRGRRGSGDVTGADAAGAAEQSRVYRGAALVGVLLVLIAIWLDVIAGASYWRLPFFQRSLGILLLLVAVAAGALLLAALGLRDARAGAGATAVTAVMWGLLLVLPVGAAFGDLGNLEVGAWLGLIGGALAAIGAAAADATRRIGPARD